LNGNPSKKQLDWHEWLRECGCVVCGDYNPAIHHIKGSKMKLKGCVKPGEWFVIPLCYKHHQGVYGIHTDKTFFNINFGYEKHLWGNLMYEYTSTHDTRNLPLKDFIIIRERG
jgi:hypothetical protein